MCLWLWYATWLPPIQVDVNPNGGGHTPVGAWDSAEHLNQATGILVYFIKRIQNKFSSWSTEQQLKGLSHSLIIISSYSDHRLHALV